MAFAPHNNQDYADGKNVPLLVGQFVEADHGHTFEYADRPAGLGGDFAPEAQHLVYVGGEGQYRFARVLKTVAYIITNVNDDNEPVWEKWQIKWQIKQHRRYATAWAVTERAERAAREIVA